MRRFALAWLCIAGIASGQYNDLGGPVFNLARADAIAARQGVATVAGTDSNGALVLVRAATVNLPPTTFSHLGGLVRSQAISVLTANEVVVGGSVNIGGLDRAFLTKVNSASGLVTWTIIEPPRTVPTTVDSMVVGPDFVVVGCQLQGVSGAVCYELSTGIERWRTTFPATVRRKTDVAVRANGDAFVTGTTDMAGGTAGIVRCITPTGSIRWTRQLSIKAMERCRVTSGDDGLIVLGTNDTLLPTSLLFFRLNLATGSIVKSLAKPRGISLSTPLMETSRNRVICRFSEIPGALIPGIRKALIISDDLLATIEEARLPDGTDTASCSSPDFSPHFASNVFDPTGKGEVSRETNNISHISPAVTGFAGVATDGARVFAFGPAAAGGVKVQIFEPQPFASGDFFEQVKADVLNVPAPGIFANDVGALGSTVVLATAPTHGAVTLNPDGSFLYSATPKGFLGDDTFEYRLVKGGLSTPNVLVRLRFQPHAISLILDVNRLRGGRFTTGRVVFEGPRQVTNGTYPLGSNNPAVAQTSASSIVVPVGASVSPSFTVSTTPVQQEAVANIISSDGDDDVIEVATLTVEPPLVATVVAENTTIVGGAGGRFTVALDGTSPAGGFVVTLSDDSTAIAVPNQVVVPAGSSDIQFTAPTATVTTSRTAVVSATTLGATKTVTVAIVGVTLALGPATITGGQSSTGTLTLTSNALGNSVVFDLSDDSTSTGFSGTQKGVVPAGFRTGQFNVISVPVTTNRTSTITATNGGVSRTATLSVLAASVASVTLSPNPVVGGNPFAGLVQLTGKAPAAGLTVTLSDNAGFVTVPASVFVAGASDLGLWVGTTQTVTASTMVIVTASLGGQTRTTTIVVTP